MPYLSFPDNWPVFAPKDKLAKWMEFYAQAMEMNVWTSTVLKETKWDGTKWEVTLARHFEDGRIEIRTFYPRHIIQATGLAGEINLPDIKGMDEFQGSRLCHSSQFRGAQSSTKGKRALVIGSCNSAHDIAQDYYEQGYEVTMVQRSDTCVDPSRYSKGKGLYAEDGPVTEEADFITHSVPTALLKRREIESTEKLELENREFFEGLKRAGFQLNRGPDGSG